MAAMFQIQPQERDWEKWSALALREGFCYEVLELSVPPMAASDDGFERRCEWYRASGRVRSLHGAFIDVNPASGDPAFRTLSRRRSAESCELAVRLGAKNVVLHSSCFPFLRGAYLDHWADECAAFYQSLAQTYALGIFIENSMDVDPTPLAQLMRRVSDGRVGVCLDFGHANYSRAPLSAWLDALGERVGYLHLSDNAGAFDDHLPLGEGTVDWKAADAFWRGLRRDVPVTFEVGGIEGVERSLAFLKERRYFGMGEA